MQQFPAERQEKRQALLQAVDSVGEVLAANADESEALRTLPQASVAALRDSGLFRLKLPTQLGGAEADPVTQIDVIEAVSYIDSAAGWNFLLAQVLSACVLSIRMRPFNAYLRTGMYRPWQVQSCLVGRSPLTAATGSPAVGHGPVGFDTQSGSVPIYWLTMAKAVHRPL